METGEKHFSAIILAGGKGKRVGGQDKGLLPYKNKTLVKHVIDAVEPLANEIIISANRNIKNYEAYGYRVVPDTDNNYQGPLAGLAAALPYCRNKKIFITPCDMPLLSIEVFQQLSNGLKEQSLCIAEADNKLQPVFLMNKKLLASIEQFLKNDQLRLMQWAKAQQPNIARFPASNYFRNFNSINDFQ